MNIKSRQILKKLKLKIKESCNHETKPMRKDKNRQQIHPSSKRENSNTGCRLETEQKYLFIAQARKHI